MWYKSTVTKILLLVCPLLMMAACDGATISDSLPVSTPAGYQEDRSASPVLISSFPRTGQIALPADGAANHYLVVINKFWLDLVLDDGTFHLTTHMQIKTLPLAISLILISLGLYKLLRWGGAIKAQGD